VKILLKAKKRRVGILSDLPEGVLGEVISITSDSIFHQIGINVGMSVVVLKKAVNSIIEVGYHQLEITHEISKNITVCYEI
jgi:feoA domain